MFFLKKRLSFFFLLFLVVFFFAPLTALAQGTPETNPLCWGKEACQRAIEKSNWKWDEKKNFLLGGPGGVCGAELGVCIPAGQTDTEITIGGKVKFTDLGDYIRTIYTWMVGIGGLVAVILIIVGGFIYMTSAGSPDRVKAAKERISHALLGLLLLLGSYTLLYTINPDLVRLRLPKVYMLRRVELTSLFCSGTQEGMLAYGGTAVLERENNKVRAGVPFTSIKDNEYTINLANFWSAKNIGSGQAVIAVPAPAERNSPKCGWAYYLQGGSGEACMGDICPTEGAGGFVTPENNYPQVCTSEDGELYSCVKGVISGIITGDEKVWKFPWVHNKGTIGPVDLYLACNDGEDYKAGFKTEVKENSAKKILSYRIEASVADLDKLEAKCSSHDGVKGYLLVTLTNGLGLFRPDFIFVLGKTNSNTCNFDFDHTSQTLVNWLSSDFIAKLSSVNLIKPTELRQGLICNIDTESLAKNF